MGQFAFLMFTDNKIVVTRDIFFAWNSGGFNTNLDNQRFQHNIYIND